MRQRRRTRDGAAKAAVPSGPVLPLAADAGQEAAYSCGVVRVRGAMDPAQIRLFDKAHLYLHADERHGQACDGDRVGHHQCHAQERDGHRGEDGVAHQPERAGSHQRSSLGFVHPDPPGRTQGQLGAEGADSAKDREHHTQTAGERVVRNSLR